MKILSTTASALLAALTVVSMTASKAEARIVCNEGGDCWHVHSDYEYAPSFGLTIHDDNWRWEGTKYHWREHEGRGYWKGSDWTPF